MACGAYYNENDLQMAAWLRELITAGLIADGEVDTRSIADVHPADLAGFAQCHFFAGIGGWSYALRLAGWADKRPVWTGSCPCQPFSSAGAQAGGHDPRDLWPAWFQLIRECRPRVLFGEQVEAAIAHGWLDRVCDDLESEGYAVGAACLPAASVGAFHIRQRLWFVADAAEFRHDGRRAGEAGDGRDEARIEPERFRDAGELAAANDARSQGRQLLPERPDDRATRASGVGDMAITDQWGCEVTHVSVRPTGQGEAAAVERGASFWSAADWIPCADGAYRPVEPGTFPLAHGLPARVGRLRGYGNAIVPQVAAEFIAAYMEITCS